ncbi:hypothetical protein A8O28_04700 [Enterobacteriaceae bacterium CCUG 67584]|nr:hypothetical protein [Enterobacteriaceae bacterium CCUG 67584]
MPLSGECTAQIQYELLSGSETCREGMWRGEAIKKPPVNTGGAGITHGQLFFDGLGFFITRFRRLARVIFFNILHEYLPLLWMDYYYSVGCQYTARRQTVKKPNAWNRMITRCKTC